MHGNSTDGSWTCSSRQLALILYSHHGSSTGSQMHYSSTSRNFINSSHPVRESWLVFFCSFLHTRVVVVRSYRYLNLYPSFTLLHYGPNKWDALNIVKSVSIWSFASPSPQKSCRRLESCRYHHHCYFSPKSLCNALSLFHIVTWTLHNCDECLGRSGDCNTQNSITNKTM
jgi:hypothetical protein